MEALPTSVTEAIDQLSKTVDQERLPHASRLAVIGAVRSKVISRRKPGRKGNRQIDRAYTDYKAGVRGLELYRKHIPNFCKLSRWRRVADENRLLKNLQKRAQREKQNRVIETNPS